MKSLVTYLFILCYCLSSSGLAQNPSFDLQKYDIEAGLPGSYISSLARDQEGFLWVGTLHGLARFDGYEFKVFQHQPQQNSLASNSAELMSLDSLGNIWISAKGSGLNQLDTKTLTFSLYDKTSHPSDTTFSIDNIKCIETSADEKVWFGLDSGLWCFDKNNNTFEKIFPAADFLKKQTPINSLNIENQSVTAITLKHKKEIWIGTQKGEVLKISQETSDKAITIQHIAHLDSRINDLYLDEQNELWMATDRQQLVHFNPQSKQLNTYDCPSIIHVFSPAWEANSLLVGTNDGILVFSKISQSFSPFCLNDSNTYSTDERHITRLILDQEKTIWIGTNAGLFKARPTRFTFHHLFKKCPSLQAIGTPRAIIPTTEDKLLLGGDNGVFWYDPVEQQAQELVAVNGVISLLMDSVSLWIGTWENGLYHFDRTTKELQRFVHDSNDSNSISSNYIFGLYLDAQKRLWIGTWGGGVNIYDQKTGVFTQPLASWINQSGGFGYAYKFVETSEDKLWIATLSGLVKYHFKTNDFVYMGFSRRIQPEQFDARYFTLYADPQENIWIGGGQGLDVLTKNEFLKQEINKINWQHWDNKNSNLFNPSVQCILPDDRGNLWMSTDSGIYFFDVKIQEFIPFRGNYGLYRQPYIINAGAKTNDGTLYFCNNEGIIAFQPKHFDWEHPPLPQLTEVRIFDSLMTDWQELSYDQNFLHFKFSALSLAHPEVCTYAYWLEGLETDWIYCGNRHSVSWPRLAPGDYRFHLKAANSHWSEVVTYDFTINPPWWETWWFRTAVFSFIFGISFVLYKWRIQQIKKEEAMKTAFAKRIAEVEMTALRAQMNPHFVFNCLNSINRFIQMSDPDIASSYLTKFSRLIRLILDNSKENMVSLENELHALRLYIELEALRFANRFEFNIHVDEKVELGIFQVPPLIIQPFVENAIWHGLMHREGNDGFLEINLTMVDNFLKIMIKDNGIGRDKASELKSKSATQNKSYGMALTTERLQMISDLYHRQVSVEVEDLVLADGRSGGTAVTIFISMS